MHCVSSDTPRLTVTPSDSPALHPMFAKLIKGRNYTYEKYPKITNAGSDTWQIVGGLIVTLPLHDIEILKCIEIFEGSHTSVT